MTKKKTTLLCVCAGAVIALSVAGVLLVKNAQKKLPEDTQTEAPNTAQTGAWEEYLAMSPEEQEAFFEEFDTVEAFEAWKESVKPVEETAPIAAWDKPGKAPNQYRWEEYLELTVEEQEAFYQWFESEEAFKAWLQQAQPAENAQPVMKWDKPGKRPDQYTWQEYQALSAEERDAFYLWFASEEAFEAWMQSVKPAETETPQVRWDKPGKQPDQYTWQEYQALSAVDQEAFYLWFASAEDFEGWLTEAKPVEEESAEVRWDKTGKQPDAYTWDEYLALSTEEQDAFFQWFSSEDAFEAWMTEAQPEEVTLQKVIWDKPGKKPDAYTWQEYQALTAKEQDAFFQWFSSMEDFEAWMQSVKPEESEWSDVTKWEKPGKQPDQYTWEEYQALSPVEQEAFYLWFASKDAFEAWMEGAEKD